MLCASATSRRQVKLDSSRVPSVIAAIFDACATLPVQFNELFVALYLWLGKSSGDGWCPGSVACDRGPPSGSLYPPAVADSGFLHLWRTHNSQLGTVSALIKGFWWVHQSCGPHPTAKNHGFNHRPLEENAACESSEPSRSTRIAASTTLRTRDILLLAVKIIVLDTTSSGRGRQERADLPRHPVADHPRR